MAVNVEESEYYENRLAIIAVYWSAATVSLIVTHVCQ